MSDKKIPDSWAELKLESIATKITDGSHNPPKAQTSGLPMLSCRNIKDGELIFDEFRYISKAEFEREHRRTQVKEGDVLLSIVGTIGSTAVVKKEYLPVTLQRSVAVITLSNGMLPHFFRFFLTSPKGVKFLESNSAGSTQKGIYLKTLRSMPLPIPPFGEQKRIVAKIESTQSKIKTIEESVTIAEELIEKYREALLQKAFRGLLVPQDPNDEPASKLLERIRAERAKDSSGKKKKKDELPPIKPEEIPFDIPKNWEWVRLGEIVDFQGGSQPPKTEFRYKPGPGLIRLVQIRDFKSDENMVFIPEKINKRHFSKDDVMIGRYGPPIFQILRGLEGSYNVALMKAVPSACIDREYFYWYLQEPRIQRDVNRKSERAAGQTGVNLDFLNNYLVPLPPKLAQVKIAKFIVDSLSSISATKLQISLISKKTEEMKTAVLANAFWGKLVPQDLKEGTGHELLEQIQTASQEEQTQPKAKPSNKKRAKK